MKFEKVSKEEYSKHESVGYENVVIPKRSTSGSAGYDFTTPVTFYVKAHQRTSLIPTGIRCQIDDGYVLLIFVRSSIGIKQGLVLSNGTGVIDSDYYHADNEGHIMFSLYNPTDQDIVIQAGTRIMQGVFVKYGTVDDEEENTTFRFGGFGSTN